MHIENAIKMTVRDRRECLFKNFYKPKGFTKRDSYNTSKKGKKDVVLFATHLRKKNSGPTKVNEHHKLFLRDKQRKSKQR